MNLWSQDEIIILHRYGDERHFAPIEYASDDTSEIKYREFTVIEGKDVGGLTLPKVRNASKLPKNVRSLYDLAFKIKGKKIVLGAEPFDMRIPIFKRLANRHDVVYHTSWPFWNGNRVPRPPFLRKQISSWRKFLELVSIVTITEKARESLGHFGFEAKTIPHGVDTEIFQPGENRSRQEQIILFVGRFVEQKGIKDLLTVSHQFKDKNVTFQFAGAGPLSGLIDQANPNHIENLGYITNDDKLADTYRSADVLVLPSYRSGKWEELFGIVLIEAMACGTPVIATNCVGPSEIIKHGETGFLVPQRDLCKLHSRIEQVLEDRQLSEKMSVASREAVVKDYRMEKVAKEWTDVLMGRE